MPVVNGAPLEIVATTVEVYRAPVGTAFTLISASPAGTWTLVGTNGSKNYNESGVIVRKPRDFATFFTLGRTGPAKTFLNQENMEVELVLNDYSLEALMMSVNKDTADITTVAAGSGTVGYKKIANLHGFGLKTFAWMLRIGVSAYGEGYGSQINIPMGQQIGQPEEVYKKNEPVGRQLIIRALEDPTNGFGETWMQNAAAS